MWVTVKAHEQRHWSQPGAVFVNFKQIENDTFVSFSVGIQSQQ